MADAELTEAAASAEPTEMAGVAEGETESAYAWSLDDGLENEPPRRWPFVVTAAAVGVSLCLATAAGVLAFRYMGSEDQPAPDAASAPATTTTRPPRPEAAPPPVPPPPRPAMSEPPAPVALPADAGNVYVKTRSGKTACQMTAGAVGCQVAFTRATPVQNGMRASGVRVTARGSWEWVIGDIGNPDFETLVYGVTYRALGWTITPTSDGTTFINDATGHGMTVSVEGFATF